MSCILFADDDDAEHKVDIDGLYDKQQQRDLKQLAVFNKILNRVQRRIQTTTRLPKKDKHIWFTVPEFIFGEPLYDKGDCIAYVVAKLSSNGFFVKYMHPNTLFVSWENWVPTYKRNEIKKKTGIVLDNTGTVVDQLDKSGPSPEDINSGVINGRTPAKEGKQYTPIKQYKPSGTLVYNQEIFDKIEKKVSFV